ncbi:MAG: helix-turn-helix transcriptional regulator [Clostridia bacterium]|nr:helix-turn-helix transcriptional regulator [Clostridia bacterium]
MIRIKLSRILGEKRISQAELARMTGIRPNTICNLYNELVERIDLEQLDLICEALECDISDILVREPSPIPLVEKNRTGFNKNK